MKELKHSAQDQYQSTQVEEVSKLVSYLVVKSTTVIQRAILMRDGGFAHVHSVPEHEKERQLGRTSSASSSGLLPFFGRFLAGLSPVSLAFLGVLAAPAAGFASSALTDASPALSWLATPLMAFPPSLIFRVGFPALPAKVSASVFTLEAPCSSQVGVGSGF